MLILTGPKRLPDLARLLDKYPELDTVIDHMADVHPDDSEGRKLLADMARYPRVRKDQSHMVYFSEWLSLDRYAWSRPGSLSEFWRSADIVGNGLARLPGQGWCTAKRFRLCGTR